MQWFDDRTVIADDVMELARHYNERGADELIIFDLSDSDEEHDETAYHYPATGWNFFDICQKWSDGRYINLVGISDY